MSDYSKKPGEAEEHESFRADLLDSLDRFVRLEPIYKKDEQGRLLMMEASNGEMMPELKGFGFHMHSKRVTVDLEGVHEEWQCDYVVLDTGQLMQMMNIFNHTLHIGED